VARLWDTSRSDLLSKFFQHLVILFHNNNNKLTTIISHGRRQWDLETFHISEAHKVER